MSFTLRPLYAREGTVVTIEYGGWVGPQGRSGRLGEQENRRVLPLPGFERRFFLYRVYCSKFVK